MTICIVRLQIAEAIESHILHMILGEGASHEAIAQAREKYRAGKESLTASSAAVVLADCHNLTQENPTASIVVIATAGKATP